MMLMFLLLLASVHMSYTNKTISIANQGCGVTYCCFHWPPNCSPITTCTIIIRYQFSKPNNMLSVEINGKVDGWVAFGLSNRKGVMDGVKGEICYKHKNKVMVKKFQNEGTDFDFKGSVDKVVFASQVNGRLVCSYTRPLHGQNMYDITIPRYLVSAYGKMEQEDGEAEPEEHPTGAYFWTEKKVDLRTLKCGKEESTKWRLIAVHGALMVIAWIGLAFTGMLFARYTRQIFGERTCWSQKVWFQGHRTIMFFSLLFTIGGIIVVFVQAGSWRTEMGAHPYTGIIVLLLAILQPVCAYFRPNPADGRRWIFNLGHRLGGGLASILAIVTIFLGVSYMEVSPVAVIAHIVFIVVGILLMEFKQRCRSKTVVIQANDLEELYVEEDFDSLRQDSMIRKIFMVLMVLVGIVTSIIMIALMFVKSGELSNVVL